MIALDTETTGLDLFHGCRPFMVTGCDGKHNHVWKGQVDPFTRDVHWEPRVLDNLQNVILEHKSYIFHNLNFDRRALKTIDIHFNMEYAEDTLIASHCICSGDVHGLKDLAVKYLNYSDHDETDLHNSIVSIRDNAPPELAIARLGHPHFPAARKGTRWWKQDMWLDIELCQKYAIHDVVRTWHLWHCFRPQLFKDQMWEMYRFRMRLLPVLYDTQTNGIHYYTDKSNQLVTHLIDQRERLQQALQDTAQELAGKPVPYIDPAKDEILNYLLYTLLDLEVINSTHKGQPSTSADTLDILEEEHLDLPAIQYLKAWRKVDKRISSCTSYQNWCSDSTTSPSTSTNSHNPLLTDCNPGPRLHSSLNATGTDLTRQSSSDPNQQNFDKWLVFLFGPPQGYYWFYADVVNIELRIWAYQVGSTTLIQAFETGQSVHMMIANLLYPESVTDPKAFKESQAYTDCKSGTFARMYGGSVNKTNNTYGVPNACAIIDSKLPEIGRYFTLLEKRVKASIEIYGYPSIRTIQGYRLEVDCNETYKAPNSLIQGSAGLIVQDMMIQIVEDTTFKLYNMKMIQQVHDSLKIEIPCHDNSSSTNDYLNRRLGEIGSNHIPTCPMDYHVIEYHGLDPIPEPNYVRAVMISASLPPSPEDAAAWLCTQPPDRVDNFFSVAKELYDNRKEFFTTVKHHYTYLQEK